MIYVFKTSVKLKKEARQLKPYLDNLLNQATWNFDLEDCDKILRIDSQPDILDTVTKLLQDKGFDCEELTD
ncbi:MAG: hypothetical protein QM763_13095 [Agriterribacter sp.]